MNIRKTVLAIAVSIILPSAAYAADAGNLICPNYMIQAQNPMSHCWDSMFPMRIGGRNITKGRGVGSPYGAHKKSICKCSKWYWRVPRGYWHATRLVDISTSPTCSPSQGPMVKQMLSAISLATLNSTLGGGVDDSSPKSKSGFFHVHSWKYPFTNGLRTWVKGDQYEGSLQNPFWKSNDPVMVNWLYPEYSLIAGATSHPLVEAATQAGACLAETTGFGQPASDMMYWLSGCGENALPVTGHLSSSSSTVAAHTAILARYLNLSNRMGGFAARSNVGEKAWCTATPAPVAMKSEFKISMVAPYTEGSGGMGNGDAVSKISSGGGLLGGNLGSLAGEVASYIGLTSRCDHRVGTSEYKWGLGKSDQMFKHGDENATYLIWRWVDAC